MAESTWPPLSFDNVTFVDKIKHEMDIDKIWCLYPCLRG